MYNKLFSKIVDSSIWLEAEAVRLVWLTMIAIMDEDGFVAMATAENLSRRANIDLSRCVMAVEVLESPDSRCQGQDYDGRRIERVPEGWIVLNAKKYRDIVTKATQRESTRQRVARFRASKQTGNGAVTDGNKMQQPVAQSEADTDTEREVTAHTQCQSEPARRPKPQRTSFETWWTEYPKKASKGHAWKAWQKLKPDNELQLAMVSAVRAQKLGRQWREGFIPNPTTWLTGERWSDDVEPVPLTPMGILPPFWDECMKCGDIHPVDQPCVVQPSSPVSRGE